MEKWNKLEFINDQEYYETLGFLAKEKQIIGIITEANEQAGAGGSQGKLTISSLVDLNSLPTPLKNAFVASPETRISETKFIRHLQENHGFTKETDNSGRNFTKHLSPQSFEVVINSIPGQYIKDFYRGYHWNCEVVKRARNLQIEDINDDYQSEQESLDGHTEGRRKEYYTTKYERNSKNRKDAIRIHGTKCMICGFDFEKVYGELGANYIEVHHIKPLASLDEETTVDPRTDLVCVCANCHRMLHRFKSYMMSIEELKTIVEDNNRKENE